MRKFHFLTLLAWLAVGFIACGPAPNQTPPPSKFLVDDYVRCRSGGGEGREDLIEIWGDGRLRYRAMGSTKIQSSELQPAELEQLLKKLVAAGFMRLRETPNREVENYGIVIEARLEGQPLRATIGALQIQKPKHQVWRDSVGVLLALLEAHGLK